MNLLSNCTSGGCGAKIGPGELREALGGLPAFASPSLLVGFDASDDAAVYQLTEDQAIISTVDFFSPMVEDPYLFGQIGAANALSDVYAMGGRPLFALNLLCFPHATEAETVSAILAGGADKAREAGIPIAGGHSIYDHEPKYGLAVTGAVHPGRILRNTTCQTGDALILTKPLGVGLVMSALRAGEAMATIATPEIVEAATRSMARLNRYAAEKMAGYPVHACTDITGFGLAVHAAEMAGDGHTLVIDADSLPVLPGALSFAEEYLSTAAGQRNRNYMAQKTDITGLSPARQELIFDPQTSGGLLISVAVDRAEALCEAIKQEDPCAAIIGQVVEREREPVLFL